MSKVSFSDVFAGEYFQVINTYSKRIQEILYEYDLVIFMARKAICFYDAMIKNGVVHPTKCKIISSRVLDYNIIKKYSQNKIAIIDDVVVKGDSLRRVAQILSEYKIVADTFVIACEKNFKNNFNEEFANFKLQETYTCLSQKAIYSFSAMVTEYIEATKCPFNIDQPIYIVNSDLDKVSNILSDINALDITSGLQREYGIKNEVIYFNLNDSGCFFDETLKEFLKDSIIKMRFLSSANSILIMPFVLFSKMSYSSLYHIYSLINTQQSDEIIENSDENVKKENILKVIDYFFSELLFNVFAQKYNIIFKKYVLNDIFQFADDTKNIYGSSIEEIVTKMPQIIDSLVDVSLSFSKFLFTEQISNIYRSIIRIDPNEQHYYDYNGRLYSDLDEPIITTDYLETSIMDEDNKKYIASCAVDVLIDKGMIVPSIVHCNGDSVVRAYKLGEYSKLERTHILEFASMLGCYQKLIDAEIDRTEFEKLCVIYFDTAIHRKHFVQQTKYEDDCYGVSYSLYGPRISASKVSYKVNSRSSLANKFLDEDEAIMVENFKKKYIINPLIGSDLGKYGTLFAYKYSELRKLFQSAPSSVWNKYASTYNQYLTLRAIGESNKNKFLSLCAELYQLTQFSSNIFKIEEQEKKHQRLILSGIGSGLWKYNCYVNNVLQQTFKVLFNRDMKLALSLGDDYGDEDDKNIIWNDIIDRCAEILFASAYLVNEVAIKYGLVNELNFDEFEFAEFDCARNRNSLFTARDMDCDRFKALRNKYEREVRDSNRNNIEKYFEREISELKSKAQLMLDLADLFLESNNPNYKIITKLLVVYFGKSIPKNLVCEDLKQIKINGLINKRRCQCYLLDESSSGIPVLNSILEKEYGKHDVHFIVMNVDKWQDGFILVDNKARGRQALNIMNEIIGNINNLHNVNTVNSLITVGDGFKKSFRSQNYIFEYCESNSQPQENNVIESYEIYKDSTFKCNNNQISIGVLCAIDRELNAIIDTIENVFNVKCKPRVDKAANNRINYLFEFEQQDKQIKIVLIEQFRQGTTSAALGYSYLIKHNLDLVVFCGIAGSLTPKIKIGDVIIPFEIIDSTLKKEKNNGAKLRGATLRVSSKLIDLIKLVSRQHNTQNDERYLICNEPLLSDNTVIACDDSDVIKNVLSFNDKVAGVEMESSGIYEADYETTGTRDGVLTIRGVSDNANSVKNDKFHRRASINAAKALCEFIITYINLRAV